MKDIHPLKRKSIKPSSSTVRGMLPIKQFRNLDAALQSLRATGLRFDWQWRDEKIGWACAGLIDEHIVCELRPTQDPLVGIVWLTPENLKIALNHPDIEAKYKKILKFALEESKKGSLYEFELESTPERDMFSNFVEQISLIYQ